ncbi:hypothetical protein R4P64_32580 [Rhodococcus sp. IEGM 1366]|uniref:hypothetical protein n=1 Tax=Rhodococcus sp. IEGM 1366 TaxID=3082223 RepID=UPI002955A5F4|nr:hypothetical protein [Rhodococcus sp. IEGM 1366]MDV8071254.1 hypothetical protein [Rhodococcus sp. IEGM 1366]
MSLDGGGVGWRTDAAGEVEGFDGQQAFVPAVPGAVLAKFVEFVEFVESAVASPPAARAPAGCSRYFCRESIAIGHPP